MSRVRSVDFLPEIFQTDANKQFLAATLDQLVQEPKFKKTQGFIGRSVGPGVNPNDKYVVEPTKTRTDYQLEPGIVSLNPADTAEIQDAITYPGILDALSFQGADSNRPDRLFTSDYYTWDPFIDFDAFVNFSQYFWVPNGPDVVDVFASSVPFTENFAVDRNGAYTFSGESGDNPIITLVRGGSYTFQIANNIKQTINYSVTNSGTASYLIDYQANPTLTLVRGNTYVFTLNLVAAYPFWIKTQPTTGIGDAYNSGVTNNGNSTGTVIFTVPQDAPDILYYAAQNNANMHGSFAIVNADNATGPGFWIQTAPGVTGRNVTSPNLSTRDVLGVVNNGTNLGTITFNVPVKTAQNFYYTLNDLGTVDLLTTLNFDQIDGANLLDFLAQYGGIDGIANLDGLTLAFNNGNPADQAVAWTISFVTVDDVQYISLSSAFGIAALDKFSIAYGTVYANTQWYKNPSLTFERIPLLSAVQDTLYYQDALNPDMFGTIKLVEQTSNAVLNVTEIIGRKTYTSPVTDQYPNGVTFTNGLKVKFTGEVYPRSYWSGTVPVTCLSTAATINFINCTTTQGLERGLEIVFSSPTIGGIEPETVYYVDQIFSSTQFTISEVKGGPALPLTGATAPPDNLMYATASANREYYVSGVGTAIELLPVENFIVPESYATDANAETVYIEPSDHDYITISRASRDLNAWSRSNRWFHIDVLYATGAYNNTTVALDNNNRAKRPIIQFRPGIRLFNMGTEGKQPVNVIDFGATDAFSDIEGSLSYTTNGYTVVNGSRIIFAADLDASVRNKIYVVNFIVPNSTPLTTAGNFHLHARYTIATLGTTDWNEVADTTGETYAVGDTILVVNAGSGTGTATFAEPVINLVPADDAEILADQSTVVLDGDDAGITYWYDGVEWAEAQQKTAIQQPPIYDVYDANGISFSNNTVYPSSTFRGSKLFSYAVGVGTIDPVLQFQLQYLTLSNVGDIVFDNNLYQDTFIYVIDNVSQTRNISQGWPREYIDRTTYDRLLGWQSAVTPTLIRQQFRFTYDGQPLLLDVAALTDQVTTVPAVKVFVGSQFQNPSTYTVARTDTTTTISFITPHVIGEVVEVEVLSNQTSAVGFYQVPTNLQQNPLNANSEYFTLGTVRTHYQTICQNLNNLVGPINGANNTRDLGNIIPYGQLILQQSSPLTMAGYFMRSNKYNVFAALEYNSREYQKYKNQMLEATTRQDISYNITTSQLLDYVLNDVIVGRTDSNPFYWSDMLPAGEVYQTTTYTLGYITTDTFSTLYIYNYASANYQGMNVYINNAIQTRGVDYSVGTDSATITILPARFAQLQTGDVITIQEYQTTYGTFVPNTPTKLGLYPAFKPGIIPVKTTTGITLVIVGHDGSQTPVFNDIRDDVLLEFETRIYNNLKLDGNPIPLKLSDVIPGQFRDTGYSYTEINDILSESFLSYVGWNKLDYTTQDYNAANTFSFNYSQSLNTLDNQPLLGAWRGIYRWFYDTQQPEETPWEMLGFSKRPDWWEITYGPAPYTRDNQVLWDDLEAGLVRDPVAPYVLPQYARPGLSKVLPTSSEGALLAPLDCVVGIYANNTFQKSWKVGDGGPVEASWWNSSDYPFAAMRLLALTRPAEFFALFADRDLYRYNEEFGQYLYDDRYRLSTRVNPNQPANTNVQVYGNGVSKASYIDWIVDYNRILGQDSTVALQDDLANIDVRLCYRMASFSDKQYIKIYTEKSSPASTNTALLIPDESYDLLLYKNQPFDHSVYSSVVIQVVEDGWAVYGYSLNRPFFETLTSVPVGQFQTFTVGGTTIQTPTFYSQDITQVPYGYVFNSQTAVANFLLSYGKLLEQDGFTFTDRDNGYILNWDQMVQEFLYWSNQGWGVGTLINLNPLAYKLSITKPLAVVDSVSAQTAEHVMLDQNKREFPVRDLNIVRLDNTFTIAPLNNQSLSFVDMRFTSFESMIVLNNTSLFGDLIYEPVTGARQSRLSLVAATTTEWNGSVDAQGFILNQDNIEEWTGLKTYPKGQLVKYKNKYWSAATIVQPSTTFNYNDWNQSDYTLIQQGLLPNLANKANQLANSYNINSANLETDNDLLSYGLIGFRPRQYFTSLNLDDVSQLNVYREFIGSKGTILSADLLTRANLGKEAADYTIYENWAIQRSVYGANANRSFVDLRLNREYLTSDPVLVEVILPQQPSQADQTVLLNDVWKSSFALTTPDILPTTTESITDSSLPSAGYVNLDDVDISVFELSNPASLNANINSISNGTSIWVAKVNDYDWNIYRAQGIPGTIQHVCDNLNGTSRVIFSGVHGLSVGNTLIIRFFDSQVNGVYKVLSVSDVNTVNIAFTFTGGRTVADGNGIGFTLQTMRVAQASDISTLPYSKQILPGAKAWVDNNGQGMWQVLEKKNPFQTRREFQPYTPADNQLYGSSIAQAKSQNAMLIGSPGYKNDSDQTIGSIYVYLKGYTSQYEPVNPTGNVDETIKLEAIGTRGFGNAVDFGTLTWAAAGASASLGPNGESNNGYCAVLYYDPVAAAKGFANPFVVSQLLTLPGTTSSATPGAGELGYSVAVSQDERWLYVGAPGINKVYAYGQVSVPVQEIRTILPAATSTVNIADQIQIDNQLQISVTVNDTLLTIGTDYTVAGDFSSVDFASELAAGDGVVISRNTGWNFDGGSASYNLNPYLFGMSNIYACLVTVNKVEQRPNIDYTMTNGVITFVTTPGVNDDVTVLSKSYYQLVIELEPDTVSAGDRFGHSVQCSNDGRQVLVGARNTTVDANIEAGCVFAYDRNVQKFIATVAANTTNITVLGNVTEPVSVILNNQFLTNQANGILGADNSFTVSGNTITIYATVNVGDVIEIETNQFVLQQQITQNTPAEFVNFGQALDLCPYNCSLYVGAPQDSTTAWKGGVVQRSVAQARTYGTITATVADPVLVAGQTLRVNNVDIAVPALPNNNATGLAAAINASAPNATASVDADGYLTISVTNSNAATVGDKLQVAPGSLGVVYSSFGFEQFAFAETIANPFPVDFGAFGYSVSVNNTALSIAVGAPGASLYLPNTFDYNSTLEKPTTTFDGNNTVFFSPVNVSGAVYTFDYFPSSTSSVTSPGKFVFGQQISNINVNPYDTYGTAVNFNSGALVAGAPLNDDSANETQDSGSAFVFENPTDTPAWAVIHQQQPVVDIYLLNSVYMYDRITSERTEFFDFFDPLQGKILGAAQQNLDYIGAVDPAEYNVGYLNNAGNRWGQNHLGEMWWDISTVRFIDPNQDDIVYASRRWGQVFPGSRIDIYQWVESTVPPVNYVGVGTPKSIDSYVIETELTQDGLFVTSYYFWVRNVTTVATQQGKTLSALTVSQYIESPKSSGISYIAPINSSTIAIYNGLQYVNAADTIISVEFDQQLNDANVHAEYELIAQGRPEAFLSAALYRKLQDSFCGFDTFGNKVPDPRLPVSQQYGIQVRPRQSMFVDRFLALKNYITYVNSVLALYPISETRSFVLLNSEEPIPSANSGAWDAQVANLEILGYQDIYAVPLDYTYLVDYDSSNQGLWTIYTVVIEQGTTDVRTLLLTRVQNYKTVDYWNYINWYMPGYNSSSKISFEVANYASLSQLSVSVGTSVKVTANAQGKYEIYLFTDTGWERVGLQDGTIAISAEIYDYELGRFGFDSEVYDAQYYDKEPVVETRKIIQSINEELLIDDLYIDRNKSLTLMFDFILSELQAPEWLVKTSLIDVDHKIRELIPFQNYLRDNQTFVSDYLQEVKPYHVQVREFNLSYNGADDYTGDVTDFDLPAYYNTDLAVPQYVSPILTPYDHATNQLFNTNSDTAPTSVLWSEWPYSQWIGNYLLSLRSVKLLDQGSGYTSVPSVIIQGDAAVQAQAEAVIDSEGHVVAINVVSPGAGYSTTPTVIIQSPTGTGARGYAVMVNRNAADFDEFVYNVNPPVSVTDWEADTGNTLGLTNVRSFKTTIKFDRYQYSSSIDAWSTSGIYAVGDRVRYTDSVWEATEDNGPAAEFSLAQWTEVSAADLSGVDRTMGYYVPGINEPGLELPLLVNGVDFPGVQVFGHDFDYVDALDAIYESSFTDVFLGTRPTDVNVDGGQFIGAFENHAPEELVNGAEYDTMDLRVYTRPGSDWERNGHGFQIGSVRFQLDDYISIDTWSWANAVDAPAELVVSNITTGLQLNPVTDYTVDWAAQTITMIDNISAGDIINIDVYEIGGGSQLYRNTYTGDQVGQSLVLPVSNVGVDSIVFFVNGIPTNAEIWRPYYSPSTEWSIYSSYAYNDVVYDSNYTYYRAIKAVPTGVLLTNFEYWQPSAHALPGNLQFTGPLRNTIVTVPVEIQSTDLVTVVVMGITNQPQRIWSTPVTQYVTVDSTIATAKTVDLDNYMGGTNAANMVVVRNGLRLTPPAGIEHIGNSVATAFGLPTTLGSLNQDTIDAPTEIQVWLNNRIQVQGMDYAVTGSNPNRQVVFFTAPTAGDTILISVSTLADYIVYATAPTPYVEIVSTINIGDELAITTFNDTSEQDMVTLVFVGPSYRGITEVEAYNSTDYAPLETESATEWSNTESYSSGALVYTQVYSSPGVPTPGTTPVFYLSTQAVPAGTAVTDTGYWTVVNYANLPESFNYLIGQVIPSNNFYLNRPNVMGYRLWVTLDGERLFDGVDFDIQGEYLILAAGTIESNQILVVTEFTESVVPDACAFRIFQDMRGVQATYRITAATTATVAQDVSATADIIYLDDVTVLPEPDLAQGIFGIVTINGERIMYRTRDVATNTISSLMRGTAGTGAAAHTAGALVYDMNSGNLLQLSYQDYISKNTTIGDDSTVEFVADDLGTNIVEGSVEVYVGGIRQLQGFAVDIASNVVTVTFDTAPPAGQEVTMLVKHGVTWYHRGIDTASDGVALQQTNTVAARFLCNF